jgi:hypothetical protein
MTNYKTRGGRRETVELTTRSPLAHASDLGAKVLGAAVVGTAAYYVSKMNGGGTENVSQDIENYVNLGFGLVGAVMGFFTSGIRLDKQMRFRSADFGLFRYEYRRK